MACDLLKKATSPTVEYLNTPDVYIVSCLNGFYNLTDHTRNLHCAILFPPYEVDKAKIRFPLLRSTVHQVTPTRGINTHHTSSLSDSNFSCEDCVLTETLIPSGRTLLERGTGVSTSAVDSTNVISALIPPRCNVSTTTCICFLTIWYLA